MKRNTVGLLHATVLAGLFAAASAGAELVRNPTQVGANFDIGEIVEGRIYNASSRPAEKTKKQMISRTGVYLTESGVYNERLTIQLTLGGLFWYSLPEATSFQSRRIYFGPGVGQATGIYAFGENPADPAATLQFGFFPHKYSESVNLGEYLYRSGTYPGILYSGGWSYMNAAAYMAQGARLTVPTLNKMLTHDFTLYMERDLQPTNDLTPGYMLTAKPLPFLELGAGVVWSHAISLNSKRLDPHEDANKYSKTTGRPVSGDTTTAGLASPCANGTTSDCGYYTFKGFKTNARASLDLGVLTGVVPAGSFKLYSELALLGVEDQPFYYDDKMERMPIMFGANVPTFGLLDRLSVEAEYLKTRFPNNNSSVLEGQLPIPVASGANNDAFSEAKTNWKWTIYAKRSIITGLDIYAQAASDHLRHFNFAAAPGAEPATPRPGDWYYVLRLQFGI